MTHEPMNIPEDPVELMDFVSWMVEMAPPVTDEQRRQIAESYEQYRRSE